MSMSQTTAPAASSSPPAPPVTQKDGRTKQRSLGRRLLGRPEVGALIAAVLVYLFFFAAAPSFRETSALATVLYQASVMGIMALPVVNADRRLLGIVHLHDLLRAHAV